MISLQASNSCRSTIPRGTGFADVMYRIMKLGEGKGNTGVVKILSGQEAIQIEVDSLSLACKERSDKFSCWLNDENSHDFEPDESKVKELNHEFPGTVIEVCFDIDHDFLQDRRPTNDEIETLTAFSVRHGKKIA